MISHIFQPWIFRGCPGCFYYIQNSSWSHSTPAARQATMVIKSRSANLHLKGLFRLKHKIDHSATSTSTVKWCKLVLNHSHWPERIQYIYFHPNGFLIDSHSHLKYEGIMVKIHFFVPKMYFLQTQSISLWKKNTFWTDWYQNIYFYRKKLPFFSIAI